MGILYWCDSSISINLKVLDCILYIYTRKKDNESWRATEQISLRPEEAESKKGLALIWLDVGKFVLRISTRRVDDARASPILKKGSSIINAGRDAFFCLVVRIARYFLLGSSGMMISMICILRFTSRSSYHDLVHHITRCASFIIHHTS